MKRFWLLLCLCLPTLLAAQTPQGNPHAAPAAAPAVPALVVDKVFAPRDFPEAQLRQDVTYLAGDALEGRFTGSKGIQQAANYLALTLKRMGAENLPGLSNYRHPFQFTTEVRATADSTLVIAGSQRFTSGQVQPLAFTDNGRATGGLVFAGYGLSVPNGYDSYRNLDVQGKVVLVLQGIPSQVPVAQRAELNRYADLRYKAAAAKQRGAVGLLVVRGPRSSNAGELIPLAYDRSGASAGLLALSIQGQVAQELLAPTKRSLAAIQDSLDRSEQGLPGFAIPGAPVTLSAKVEPVQQPDNNIIALIPATFPGTNETIVLGAHYDHLGRGQTGSLAGSDDANAIHNGADDNASGVAVVLALARRIIQEPVRKRNVLICFWSGEELGLVGSAAFVQWLKQQNQLNPLKAYLNFDMVGRLDQSLQVQGTGSSPVWMDWVSRTNRALATDSLRLALQTDPYLPTDVTSFYPQGVPVLAFFTGSHSDYHKPSDDAERLNYPGMARIAALAGTLTFNLLNHDATPPYGRVNQTQSMGRGGPMRVVLGTVPDYTYQGEGLKLSGVREGSPAANAGMQPGDLLVELAGKPIASIYDYMYLLGALNGGEEVSAVVVRDGKRLPLKVTPQAR